MKSSILKLAFASILAVVCLHSTNLVALKKSNPINDDGPICTINCEKRVIKVGAKIPKKPPINDDGGGNGKRFMTLSSSLS